MAKKSKQQVHELQRFTASAMSGCILLPDIMRALNTTGLSLKGNESTSDLQPASWRLSIPFWVSQPKFAVISSKPWDCHRRRGRMV